MGKKLCSLFLAFILITSMIPMVHATESSHLIINQVYGGGGKGDTPVTHSFIELYNPTTETVDLAGWSIQYASNRGGTNAGNTGNVWIVRNLTGSIPPKHSLLIRGASEVTSASYIKYQVNAYDIDFPNLVVDNKQYRVALVSSTMALSTDSWNASDSTIVDFVSVKDAAATNEALGEGGSSKTGISKQYAVRRNNFQDTNNNATDLGLVDYRTADINSVYPRSLSDGSWDSYSPKAPKISHDGGMFQQAFDLSLTCETGASLYYTLDGSLPFPNGVISPSAILYNDTIPIAHKENPYADGDLSMIKGICPSDIWMDPQGNLFKGTVVKAVAVKEVDGIKYASSTVVNSFFITDNIFERYNLPVISITANKDDLFSDSTGIYKNYNGSGKEWERPGYIEFYEPDGTLGFKRGIGLRVYGSHSRALQQKPLSVYFKSGYDESGSSSINYPLIPGNKKRSDNTTPLNTYKGFVLRASSNDAGYTMFRDAIAHKINTGLDAYGQAYRPSVVFINGEFWGLYNIREHYNDDYVETHMGLDKDKNGFMYMEYDPGNKVPVADNPGDERSYIEFLIRLGCQDYRDLPEYSDLYAEMGNTVPNMNDPSIYDYVKQNIDIDNFIDYNIANMFFANIDWPYNNVKMWRAKNPTGALPSTWQYMMNDLDFGMGLIYNTYDTDTVRYAFGAYRFGAYNPEWATFLLERLKENDDFRTKFINRYATLLSTYYAANCTTAMVDESKNMISDAITEQRKRNVAPINGINPPYTDQQIIDKWTGDVAVVKDFLSKRPSYVNEHLKGYFGLQNATFTLKSDQAAGYLNIGGIDIKDGTPGVINPSTFTANYFKNVPVQITAQEKTGYTFSRFEVNQGGNVKIYNSKTISINTTADTVQVTARFIKDSEIVEKDNIVAAGNNGVLVVKGDGELYCYQNGTSQKVMDDVKAVWASGQYFFAQKTNNRFYVWGNDIKVPWYLENDIVTATAGNNIFYLKNDKKAYILGDNVPIENVDKIAAYGENYYYLTNGTVYKRGSTIALKDGITDMAANENGFYMLDNSGTLYHEMDSILTNVQRISVGSGHILAQGSDGNLYGLGDNTYKQLEDSDVQQIPEFKQVFGKPVCFSAGGKYSVIVDNDSVIIMGGGSGSIIFSIPVKKPPLNLITAGESHVIYTQGGRVYSWGGNDMAQLGNGANRNNSATKTELYMLGSGHSLTSAVGVASGVKQGLAITGDGKLIGWGNGESYNLTRGSNISYVDGAEIAKNVNFVTSGKNHTMYVSNNNVLYGAGYNEKNKLGISGYVITSFTKIMDNIYVAGAGDTHSVALALDGTLYGFGDNTYGQLGVGGIQINTPTPILSDVKMAWAAKNMTLVLKTDGSLWGFGDAPAGQFGTGSATTGASLIHIADNVKSASLSNTHILVLKEDGSVWSAGSNTNGELGLGNTDSNMHGLEKVMENVAYVATGSGFSAVMTNDGSAYTWGKNDKGQLGCGNMNPTLDIQNPISAGTITCTGTYVDNNLQEVTSLNNSKFIMAQINVASTKAASSNLQVILATYDARGCLRSLSLEPVSAAGNSSTQIQINSYVNDPNVVKLKVMLWDASKELCPLITLPALQ